MIATHRGRQLVFRMDRVQAARVLEAPAERPADFHLAEYWSAWEADYAASLPTFIVTARLGPLAQRYRDALGAVAPRAVTDEVTEADGWTRQSLLFDGRQSALSALLALSPEVEILAPPDMRDALLAAATAILERNTVPG